LLPDAFFGVRNTGCPDGPYRMPGISKRAVELLGFVLGSRNNQHGQGIAWQQEGSSEGVF
ncbi:MAG TPA: hypothetical protein VF117_05680, partial [Gammaproteobacteria bacterium]